MRLVRNLALALALGFIGHYLPFEKMLGEGWNSLANHAAGVLFALWPYSILLRILGQDEATIQESVVAYLATYVAVGGGSFAGWLSETLINDHLRKR